MNAKLAELLAKGSIRKQKEADDWEERIRKKYK
jgi:hypothetical protein